MPLLLDTYTAAWVPHTTSWLLQCSLVQLHQVILKLAHRQRILWHMHHWHPLRDPLDGSKTATSERMSATLALPPSFMHWLTRRTSRLRTCGEPALLCSLHSPMERRCLVLEYLVHATTSPTLRRGRGTSKKWSCCLPQRKGWALRSFSGTACIARHLSTLQRMPPNSTPICIANPNLSGNCKGHYSLATQCLTGPRRCSQT